MPARLRVFVAGGSGAIGRQLVPLLVQAGHRVMAMTRSRPRAHPIFRAGAEPLVCNVFDQAHLERALSEFRPDVLVNQLTQIPRHLSPRKIHKDMAATNHLRTQGTRLLVELGETLGVRRFVSQSVAFAYAPSASPLACERDPLYVEAPREFAGIIAALQASERAVLDAQAMEGVILRYGFFYGPGTAYAGDGGTLADIARGRLPVIGGGTGRFSFIHIADAARATLAAIEGGEAGIYNISDDDPAPVNEWLPFLAQLLDARRPRKLPEWAGRLLGGPYAVFLMTQLPGASNRRARTALGWQPEFSSWRTGFKASLDAELAEAPQ